MEAGGITEMNIIISSSDILMLAGFGLCFLRAPAAALAASARMT